MALVMTLGKWRDLSPETEVYHCRVCGNSVSPGNDGTAISLPTGGYEYEHYRGNCVQDKPAKTGRKKRAGKNEHKG